MGVVCEGVGWEWGEVGGGDRVGWGGVGWEGVEVGVGVGVWWWWWCV